MQRCVAQSLLAATFGVLFVGPTSEATAQSGGCPAAGSTAEAFKSRVTRIVTTTNPATRTILQDMGITDSLAAAVSLVTNDSICIEVAKSWAANDSVTYDSAKVAVVKIGTNTYVAWEPPRTPRPGYQVLYVCNQLFVHKGYLTW